MPLVTYRNRRLIVATFIAATSLLPVAARDTTATDILLITLDDLGTELGCYGDPYVKTPHIDAIAEAGIRFNNGWVTQPGCSPSRGSIMTGLYPHQNGLVGLAHLGYSMNETYPTIPSLLKEAGYFTGVIGKVHIAPGPQFDFEIQQGQKGLHPKDSAAYATKTGEFLKAVGESPFFLNVSFIDPHRPFVRQHNGLPENPLSADDVKPLPFLGDVDTEAVREDTAGYYNNVMRADAGVGMVLDELKRINRLDKTVIILIGDHGAPVTRAKTSGNNSGYRIPYLVKWPDVSSPESSSNALVSTIDLLPTVLDIAGLPSKENLPGKSLRDVVENPAHPHRDYMFGEHTAHLPYDFFPRRTVRDERFQVVYNLISPRPNPEDGSYECAAWNAVMIHNEHAPLSKQLFERFAKPPRYELYDLQDDPNSFTNLADDPHYASHRDKLLEKLSEWQIQTKDEARTTSGLKSQEQRAQRLHRQAMKQPRYRQQLIKRGRLAPDQQ